MRNLKSANLFENKEFYRSKNRNMFLMTNLVNDIEYVYNGKLSKSDV